VIERHSAPVEEVAWEERREVSLPLLTFHVKYLPIEMKSE
jgi:hypothetical protein